MITVIPEVKISHLVSVLWITTILQSTPSNGDGESDQTLTCCKDNNCRTTCTAGSDEVCLRRFCTDDERGFRSRKICPAGCGSRDILYQVSSNAIERPYTGPRLFDAYCTTSKCNANPIAIENCFFPPKVKLQELKCHCTPDGMKRTRLQYGYGSDNGFEIDFTTFCSQGYCTFSEIKKKMKASNTWDINHENGYACVLEETHGGGISVYGCDLMDVSVCGAGTPCSVSRYIKSPYAANSRDTVQINCRDSSLCNDRSQILTKDDFVTNCPVPADTAAAPTHCHAPLLLPLLCYFLSCTRP